MTRRKPSDKRRASRRRQTASARRTLSRARHEAAHAVVSIRLGLPLKCSSIGVGNDLPPWLSPTEGLQSGGMTTMEDGTAERWLAALTDETVRAKFVAFAAFNAAGLVADADEGLQLGDVSHSGDLVGIVQVADLLGVGKSYDEPAVGKFVATAIRRARSILRKDDGAAWRRVTVALARTSRLTGAEVAALVTGGRQ